MNTTPLWVVLLGLLTTLGGTLGGVVITQRRSDRRETLTYERRRSEERERWVREDALRTFAAKSEAVLAYYDELRESARKIREYSREENSSPSEDPAPSYETAHSGWHLPVAIGLDRLRIYGSQAMCSAAEAAYVTCYALAAETRRGSRCSQATYDKHTAAEEALVDAMRAELGIEGPGPLIYYRSDRSKPNGT